ncbi:Mrp/NBP35 family ATP-binding protein [Halostella sp. JP-L12]|uniref:Mrp/NBP35 family ATP-binding protein n=1 Tax=Halostella TaxID=1843185 RepID=UPI000EF83401|nr:Mrp/NBP35 family ATP-binding protein [Halostella sp. JP-L12]
MRDASVGRDALFADLVDTGGIGDITANQDVVSVTLTLPVPSAAFRASIERELTDAIAGLPAVTSVDYEWKPDAADGGARIDFIPDVKNVVAVASGKGGVGKSTVAVNLAAALADAGGSVGLLDADIYGPNVPTMLGAPDDPPTTTRDDTMVPHEAHGVKVMSIDFIVDESDPVIWRGPMVDDMLKQLFGDVEWGELDYLIVDLPPGTGDAHLTLTQHIPVTGAVIVTTPQAVAVDDAERGLDAFAKYQVPILGVAENMSYFECPDCDSDHDIFGTGGGAHIEEEYDVPVLSHLPIDPSVGTLTAENETEAPGISIPLLGDLRLPRTREEREPVTHLPPIAIRDEESGTKQNFRELASRTAARVNLLNQRS